MSPIPGASEAYQNESIGKVMNVYNNLLQNGIDPLRSMEGRMALRNAMNSIDYNKLAIMRESAKIREEYDTAVKQAKLAGKYNDELEKIALEQEGIDLSQPWDNNKLIGVLRDAIDRSRKVAPLEEVTTDYVHKVVERCDGNISEAAKLLGITRQTLYAKMKRP